MRKAAAALVARAGVKGSSTELPSTPRREPYAASIRNSAAWRNPMAERLALGGVPALSNFTVGAELESGFGTDPEEGPAEPTTDLPAEASGSGDDGVPMGPTGTCPVTAVFSYMVAGAQKANCQIASGKYGAARLAQFRVVGAGQIPPGGLSIAEQFTAMEDPYQAFGLLKPNTATTDSRGIFDDCYRLESPNPLPSDFRLKVEQNHLFTGQVISQNHITYTDSNVLFCSHARLPGKCEFSKRCK